MQLCRETMASLLSDQMKPSLIHISLEQNQMNLVFVINEDQLAKQGDQVIHQESTYKQRQLPSHLMKRFEKKQLKAQLRAQSQDNDIGA